jgi:hypothetical protein
VRVGFTPLAVSSNLGIDSWPADLFGTRSQAPEQSKARSMPGDNRLWFDNDQDVAPCRPKAAEQDPKHSILDSQPRARLFSLEHALPVQLHLLRDR